MAFWIDTHCHLDASEFDPDRTEVRAAGRAAGVGHVVIPAVARSNWGTVRELAHAGNDSYALGIHPLCTPGAGDCDLEALAEELEARRDDPRLVAIGEIGLDFFVPGLDAEHQTRIYRAQIQLARKFDLPVLLHVRKSSDRVLQQLRATPVRGGIAHAFNGSAQQAQIFIDMGFKLGFGGALTFERALRLRELATALPLSALVMETDSPDIQPQWVYTTAEQRAAGQPQGRNSPAELPRIAAVIAGLRGIGVDELAEASTANACAALPGLAALIA